MEVDFKFKLSSAKQEWVRIQIKELLQDGIITYSNSPCNQMEI